MFGSVKQITATSDAAILIEALEKIAKAVKPGSFKLDGVDIGKVAQDALKKFKS